MDRRARGAVGVAGGAPTYLPLPLDAAARSIRSTSDDGQSRAGRRRGLVYGAGIGRFGKPQFFLGELEREERRDGVRVLVAGREIRARPVGGARRVARRHDLRAAGVAARACCGSGRRPGRASAPTARCKAALDALRLRRRRRAARIERMARRRSRDADPARARRVRGRAACSARTGRRCSAASRAGAPSCSSRAVRDHLADCLVTLPALLGARRRCVAALLVREPATACAASCFRASPSPTRVARRRRRARAARRDRATARRTGSGSRTRILALRRERAAATPRTRSRRWRRTRSSVID